MDYQIIFNKNKGFSLLEVLIVIGIISIISLVSFSSYNAFRNINITEIVTLEIVGSLRYAQSNSQATKGDSSWGVKMQENNLIIFKGDDYTSRDSNFDEIIKTSSKINLSGLDEVVFERLTGFSDVGDITFSIGEKEKIIKINEKGVIHY